MKRLDVGGLHERHPGLTERVAGYYAEAVAVCLSRRHTPPQVVQAESDRPHKNDEYEISWEVADDRLQRAYANEADATRDAAYGLAIAVVEQHLGLVVWSRAQEKSGADYYLIPAGSHPTDDDVNLEEDLHLIRLEVSGIDADTPGKLNTRARLKVEQLREGTGMEYGYAAVVGFESVMVLLRWYEDR